MSSPAHNPAAAGLTALLNAPDTFTYRGTEYRVSELALLHHEEYSRWLKDKAAREAEVATADWPEPARRLYLSVVAADIGVGKYDVGSAYQLQSLTTVPGLTMALWLGLKQHDPTIPQTHARQLVVAALTEREKVLADALRRAGSPPPKS